MGSISVCSFLWHYEHQELLFQNNMKENKVIQNRKHKMNNEIAYLDFKKINK